MEESTMFAIAVGVVVTMACFLGLYFDSMTKLRKIESEKITLSNEFDSLTKGIEQFKVANDLLTIKNTDLQKELRTLQDRLEKEFQEKKAIAYKTLELEFKEKLMQQKISMSDSALAESKKVSEENFEKLRTALAKLHEEGNAQTKFTEKIALEMMKNLRPDSSKKIAYENKD